MSRRGVFPRITGLSKFSILATFALGSWQVTAQTSIGSYTPPSSQSQQIIKRTRDVPPSMRAPKREAPPVMLGALQDAEIPALDSSGAHRIGAARVMDGNPLTKGTWSPGPQAGDPPVWRVEIVSPGAVGLRLHLVNFQETGGLVWVHNGDAAKLQVLGPYERAVLATTTSRDVWTEVLFGEHIVLEYQAQAGAVMGGDPPFQIAELIHFWEFMGLKSASLPKAVEKAPALDTSCMLDAVCYETTSPIKDHFNSVVYLVIVDHTCTGTMLNDPANSGKPWMLTAGHCITSDVEAASTLAYANYQTGFCGAVAPPDYYTLPYASGAVLLAQSNLAAALDYAFVLMNSAPGGVTFSGWSTDLVTPGLSFYDISHPRNLSKRFAQLQSSSSRTDSFSVSSIVGRMDHGSSGSSIFDADGATRGVLSTGPNGQSVSACSLPDPFYNTFTRYSSIHPKVKAFLDGSQAAVSFSASPNPITLAFGTTVGRTTLSWNAPGFSVNIMVDGKTMAGGLASSGSVVTGTWVSDGMTFSLVDAATSKVLATSTVRTLVTVPTSTISANPNPITLAAGANAGKTTLTWNAPGRSSLEIRVGGKLFAGGLPSSGSTDTGNWVSEGMIFTLVDSATGVTVASTIAHTTFAGPQVSFTASPNPITLAAGSSTGKTTLSWNAPGYSVLQISITGKLFAAGLPGTGTAETGDWVSDGMTFSLVDPISSRTLATVTAQTN